MSERILAPFKSPVLRGFDDKPIGQRLKEFVDSGQISFEITMDSLPTGHAKHNDKLRNCIIYPLPRDDCINKPTSLVADFDKVTETAEMAFEGRQIQPILSR